jgi:hypothetical protein
MLPMFLCVVDAIIGFFKLTRIELTEFLAQVMVACMACVSVGDDYLSGGRGGLLAARLVVEISLSGRVRYTSQFCMKFLMTVSWEIGVRT